LKKLFSEAPPLLAWFWIPFLPEKERVAAQKKFAINIDSAFIFSTFIQLIIFFFLMVDGALDYQYKILNQLYPAAMKTGDERVTVGFFMQGGLVTLISYLFTLRGFITTLGFLDAAIRLIAYAILKDPIGSVFCTVPIACFRIAKRFLDHLREKVEFGPITPDEIRTIQGKDSEEIFVLCARQKDWNPAITIRYKGTDFHPQNVTHVKHGKHMRYSYRLLPQDENEIIRRLVIYEG
jgi:hypothetical protein